MGIFEKFKQRCLKDNIVEASNWIAETLQSSGYTADFSVESLKEIDRFLDENVENNKIKLDGLSLQDASKINFAIGSYVGEAIRRQNGGEWITDDRDPQGETYVALKLPDETQILPVLQIMKKLRNGSKESIYGYGVSL